MSLTRKAILIEDLERTDRWMEFLQQTVPANANWRDQLLWELTKYMRDLLEKETSK